MTGTACDTNIEFIKYDFEDDLKARNRRAEINNYIQWLGAVAIIIGNIFNAIGPMLYPWNIWIFMIGSAAFEAWAIRVNNVPQITVNIITLVACVFGLVKAYFFAGPSLTEPLIIRADNATFSLDSGIWHQIVTES